jgi:hypothetical protein
VRGSFGAQGPVDLDDQHKNSCVCAPLFQQPALTESRSLIFGVATYPFGLLTDRITTPCETLAPTFAAFVAPHPGKPDVEAMNHSGVPRSVP